MTTLYDYAKKKTLTTVSPMGGKGKGGSKRAHKEMHFIFMSFDSIKFLAHRRSYGAGDGVYSPSLMNFSNREVKGDRRAKRWIARARGITTQPLHS
jgi:hypothetical protein